ERRRAPAQAPASDGARPAPDAGPDGASDACRNRARVRPLSRWRHAPRAVDLPDARGDREDTAARVAAERAAAAPVSLVGANVPERHAGRVTPAGAGRGRAGGANDWGPADD